MHPSDVLNLAGKVLSVMSTVTLGYRPYVCMRHNLILTLYFPMFPFDPPENIRKPKVF